jgi:hypothetical protein
MITYRTFQDIVVPVLHRVYYNHSRASRFDIWQWCKSNCKKPFYQAPVWTGEYFVELEDDEDAVVFALRWA